MSAKVLAAKSAYLHTLSTARFIATPPTSQASRRQRPYARATSQLAKVRPTSNGTKRTSHQP